MSSSERNWKRIRDRLALQLPVRVRCRETPDFEWTEMTRLMNVTPFGAGFTLKRPTEKGRLLHMTIPMPRQLRVFDHVEDQYRVWAIVRYLRSDNTETGAVFYVGVAFIGKRPPASYEQEPGRRYEVSAGALQALASAEEILQPAAGEDRRVETRHNIPVDMQLELLDVNGAVVETEQTVTENIGTHGATLFTTLNLSQGRFIRLTSGQYGVTVHAAIRRQITGPDGVARLHVEFIDKEWPL
ncbi:MAG TPA: hypothetical protein VHH35_00635 [Pyrinomonadaceae bacterium]|nr:hypothetical protein [Pyrinomonadaceae bacterium]